MTKSYPSDANSVTTGSDTDGRGNDRIQTASNRTSGQISAQKSAKQDFDQWQQEPDSENVVSDELESELHLSESPHRKQQGLSLKVKATATALAIATLPVLALGATTYYFASQSITQQAEQAKKLGSPKQEDITYLAFLLQRQLMTLVLATGATALLTAAIAVFLVNRTIRPVLNVAQTAALTAKRLRREIGGSGADTRGGDELTALKTDLNLVAGQLPELIRQPKIEAQRMQLLTEITFRVWESQNLEEGLKTAVKEVHKALKADRVLFYRFNSDGSGTVVAEAVTPGFPRALGANIMDPCFRERHIEQYRNGRVRAIDNIYQANLTDCHIELLGGFAVKANLVAPVIKDEQLLGLLIAHQCSAPRAWQQSEINFFSLLATQIGFALDRNSLSGSREAEAEAQKLLTQFMDIILRIRESAKSEDVLKTTVNEVRKAFKTDRVLVFRINPDGSGTVIAESVAPEFPKMMGTQIVDPCFKERHAQEYENGRVRAIDNIFTANLTDCHVELLGRYSVRANLVAPVIQENKLLGLLIAHQCSTPRAWQEFEINLFTRLATQVGFALDHTSLQEQITQTRQELEGALRPRDRAIALANFGICIADANQPDYPLIYCNTAFEKITGYSQAEILGSNCRFLQGPGTDPAAVNEIRMALREQRECQVVLKNYRKDGSSFWNELTISPVSDEKGQVTHFIGLQTDISHLWQILSQVQAAAQTVTQTIQENKAAIDTLSADASIHVGKVRATVDVVGAIADSILEIAESAHLAKHNVQQAQQTALAGNKVMQQTAVNMSSIQETLTEMAAKVKSLGEVSRKASEVVNPINDFASQTSVFAMNVALEAGRAGQDNKTREFMLVAENVRSLAQQSATMTGEIEQLITTIQTATHELFATMSTKTEQLVAETKLVQETQQKLSQIVAMNDETNQLIEGIAQTVGTQAQTSGDLSQAMQEVVTIAEQTSKQSAVMADSFAYLLDVAQALQASTSQFEEFKRPQDSTAVHDVSTSASR